MELIGNCPYCSREIRVPRDNNKMTQCPYCDEIFSIAQNMRVASHSNRPKRKKKYVANIDPSSAPRNVAITGVHIPFWPLVGFMLKWALASIPALLILVSFLMLILHFTKIYSGISF